MTNPPSKNTPRRETANVDLARNAPEKLYDADYYKDGCDLDGYADYGRSEKWLTFFGNAAKHINRRFRPQSVADVGCAFGLLTEALVDLGVDAYGFDVSPYAISNAREDMKDRLRVHSIFEPIPLRSRNAKYDMAICIEVLEHLPPEMADKAIDNLCATSDRILFSSSPDDFDEPTHFNVLPTEQWMAKFAARGFHPSPYGQIADFIAPHARIVETSQARAPKRSLLSRLLGR